jgi:hypothetical protein
MKIHSSITLDRIVEMVEDDDNRGICVYCGEDDYRVEPDASKYECEACGKNGVYGAAELLMRLA